MVISIGIRGDKNMLEQGVIIQYRLLPAERPTNPNRIWKGKVIQTYLGMTYFLDCCRVVSLEPGYEELTELVLISQIIEVAKPQPEYH